ncbi:MAG: hypothetical protein OEM30_02425 [Gammaproteobacteria bacterium]|jgi:hypothetical protein|nr:hypothetical protein [Gammaproteobacteria bacterium]MDH3810164.1 hypothetical protein [Gammaproteobacteria bacterium]
MYRKIILATVTSVFLLLSAVVSADPVMLVFTCELKEGHTKEEAMAVNAKWLKWARATGGSDEITSSYVSTVVGDTGGFMWVDTYPDIATWGKIADADSEFDAEFDVVSNCSGNRMYRGEATIPAK